MSNVDLVIRRFELGDYQAVMDLWHLTGIPLKPRGRDAKEKIAAELKNNPHTLFLVVNKDGKLIGTVLATQDGRKGWINRLAVHPEWQRRGIATKLLKEAENHLHGLGIEIVTCLIEDYNRSSMEFFQHAGYIKHEDVTYFSKRKHADV